MRHERVNALLVRPDEPSSPGCVQGDGGAHANEVVGRHHPHVDGAEHRRVGDERSELLHEIERQRRPAEARLVVEADERIEPDRVAYDRQVLDEEAVRERQERVVDTRVPPRLESTNFEAAAAPLPARW